MGPELSAVDPLLYNFELPLRGMFNFVGFAIEVWTNSAEVLAAAEESWGRFRNVFTVPPIQIRIGVLPGSSAEVPPPATVRGQRNLIAQIANSKNFMIMDTRQGFAFGWLTSAAVHNRAYLRYHFLEGTAWILLESLYLTSVHGACVELEGHGILLCGDSGAGKSTLSYSCARNGWRFLSDDCACLVRNWTGRVVTGNPYQIRFRESAIQLFPELIRERLHPGVAGELAIELSTITNQHIATITECCVDYVVFLNRVEPEPEGLTQFSKSRALRWFKQAVCYGEKSVRDAHYASLRRLLSADVFEMRYSRMDTALQHLKLLVRQGPSVASEASVVAEELDNG